MSAAVPKNLPVLGPVAGSRVVVIGGAGAIGSAVMRALIATGCRVAVLDTEVALSGLSECAVSDVEAVSLDLADEDSVVAAFGKLADTSPAIDGLVNCAGFTTGHEPVESLPTELWDEVYDVNLRGAFISAKAALPMLRLGEASTIVLMSSVLGIETYPGYAHYGAAKAGVMSLTRALARENAPSIRVNAVAPAAVNTPFLTGGTGRPQEPQRLDESAYVRSVPLGRIAEVDDIVGPILFLLGDASRYITGQTILVDGGIVPR